MVVDFIAFVFTTRIQKAFVRFGLTVIYGKFGVAEIKYAISSDLMV